MTYPAWWYELCRYRYGLRSSRPDAPKPPPKWCFEEWKRFDAWNAWRDAGPKTHPRPKGLWQRTPEWAWNLRKALLAKPKPPPPPPPGTWDPTHPYLLKPGVFMYSADNTPLGAVEFCKRSAAAGVAWVALLAHEGANPPRAGVNTPQWRDAIRSAGMKCVAWGGLFEQPEKEAEFAAQAVEPFDAYIPNPELPYKLTTSVEAFERADRFVGRFVQLSGKKGAISTLVGADIHFRPFVDAGFDVLFPQCYVNDPQYPGMTPKYGVQRAAESVQHDFPGWVKNLVAPTIASYGDYQKTMTWWRPLLADAEKTRSWNYYTGEFMRDEDFGTIADMMK